MSQGRGPRALEEGGQNYTPISLAHLPAWLKCFVGVSGGGIPAGEQGEGEGGLCGDTFYSQM